MNREEWINLINKRQDFYVEELFKLTLNSTLKKEISFNSPTGTGKTIMIAKFIKKFSSCDYFFLITTLSRGGLNHQVSNSISQILPQNKNICIFGTSSLTKNTKLTEEEILRIIPKSAKLIWIRDEGHIKSNNWSRVLFNIAFKVINISATNEQVDIQCNFSDTPLLRTPYQYYGDPEDAVLKLLEVKKKHANVDNYNPCLIVRDVSSLLSDEFKQLADKYNLSFIDITENPVDVQQLSEDNNKYDVIVNKMKIVEGIDIPRANVLYIGNKPSNDATTIQLIGRVRRNALLWNSDIDIFDENNKDLLYYTTKTFIYYAKNNSAIKTENNELLMELSDTISIEKLLPDVVDVADNMLDNGYKISELSLLSKPFTGRLCIGRGDTFKIIKNLPSLYRKVEKNIVEYNSMYREIIKDKELVQISLDKNKFYKIEDNGFWKITTTVNDNIKFGKLYEFLTNRYSNEIKKFSEITNKKNQVNHIVTKNIKPKFKKSTRFLVLYYLKYKFYGKKWLEPYLEVAYHQKQINCLNCSELDLILYAISIAHKQDCLEFYGQLYSKLVPNFELKEIVLEDFNFKNNIKSAAEEGFILLKNVIAYKSDSFPINPHLGNSTLLHGVADIIFGNTIIQTSINDKFTLEDCYKALAFHYLSTKRYDLSISNICFYNFASQELKLLQIDKANLTKLTYKSGIFVNSDKKIIIEDKINLNNIHAYYNKYGKNATVRLLEDCIKTMKNKKCKQVSFLSSGTLSTSAFLKQIYRINDKDLNALVLQNVPPSVESLYYSIKTGDINLIKYNLSKQTINKLNINEAIKTHNEEILLTISNYVIFNVDNLLEIAKHYDEETIRKILIKTNIKDNEIKLIIRSQCIPAIEYCFKNRKATSSNVALAIKTKNIEVVNSVLSSSSKVSKQLWLIAKDTKDSEIISLVKSFYKP